MRKPIILDLCGGTGSWSRPYAESGLYDVRVITLPEYNVLTYMPPLRGVWGVLAAPPCTEFSKAGAWTWKKKDPQLLRDAIAIVRSCLSIIETAKPRFWALENPAGRIRAMVPELGAPVMSYDPCDYGDPWTKRTYLWGNFRVPSPSPVKPIMHGERGVCRQRDLTSRLSGTGRGKVLRSQTPPGFARAFYEANR